MAAQVQANVYVEGDEAQPAQEAAPAAQGGSSSDGVMAARIHLRGLLTGGGEVRAETSLGSADDDLNMGYGGALEVEVPLLRFLSLGGSATFTAWQTKAQEDINNDRNYALDFDVVPRLRLPFGGDGAHGAVYVGVPLGVAVSILDNSYADVIDALGGDLASGVGFHLGARAGGQIFVTRRFGFVLEAGMDYRLIKHQLDLGAADEKITLKMIHFTAQAGIVFAL